MPGLLHIRYPLPVRLFLAAVAGLLSAQARQLAAAPASESDASVLFDPATAGAKPDVKVHDAAAAAWAGAGAEAALRLTLGPARSGVTLSAPAGGWDAAGRLAVALGVRNPGPAPVALRGLLDGNGWIDGLVVLEPKASDVLEILLKRKACGDFRGRAFPGMNGLPGGHVGLWTEVDAARIRSLTVTGVGNVPGAVVEIRALRATGRYNTLAEDRLEKDFFPFVDAFGQYRHADWPGKVRDAKELADRRATEVRDLDARPGPAGWDAYGGWAGGPTLEATGHFRVQKHEGRWWLVDPDGRLFWSHGITCVRMGSETPRDGRDRWFEPLAAEGGLGDALRRGRALDFFRANLFRKYGDGWAESARALAHRRLRSWGLNTVANWSEPEVCRMRKTPYVIPVHYSCPQIGSKFPDVTRPEFRTSLRAALQAVAKETADDPWCIGYFIDNELSWPSKDRAALAETYYKICAEEMKAVAPRKLYLGSRLHDHLSRYGGTEDTVRAAAKYCDVIGVNRYRFAPDDLAMPEGVDKPLLVGEFHFGALDRGLPHTGLRSVASQEQRAAGYRLYVLEALRHPHIVGTHWFQYADQCVTGRFDGENYQIGFVDITDTPYAETIAACREVGGALYRTRAGK
jgi:hypothetical protein